MAVSSGKKLTGFIALSLIWGTTWLVIKIGLDGMPPFLGVGLRFIAAGAIVVSIGFIKERKVSFSLALLKLTLIIGILMFTISYSAVYWAEQYISSGMASIMFSTLPFYVAAFAAIILKNERLNKLRVMGMIVGVAGTALIFSENLSVQNFIELMALLAVFVSPISAAFAVVITKKNIHNHNRYLLNGGSMLVGGITTLSIHFIFDGNAHLIWNINSIGALIYLTLIGSALAFSIHFWMLLHVEATTLSFVTIVSPVVALFLGYIILSENLSGLQFAGSALVIGGVLISEVLGVKTTNASTGG
ncbi:MAG: EamA family transporter [Candidatus Marinimicrobia bacterium]|nr:EamA family transporter [Candidatus Neomarinimicrobiota bacterium]